MYTMKYRILELVKEYNWKSKEKTWVTWLDNDKCKLSLHKEEHIISYLEAIEILESEVKNIKNYGSQIKKGKGYIGRSMSVNAKDAHQRGLKPKSNISIQELKDYGFNYSLEFFKWLIDKNCVKFSERHHTSAANNYTKFYGKEIIKNLISNYNLDLLYDMYLKKILMPEAKKIRGIKYAEVEMLSSLLGGSNSKPIKIFCILCDGILFYSLKLCFKADDSRVRVLNVYDDRPYEYQYENVKKICDALVKKKTRTFLRYLK